MFIAGAPPPLMRSMTQSGATPSIAVSRNVVRVLVGEPPDWQRISACVRGPLLTLAVAVALDVLRRQDLGIRAPFTVLLCTAVYSAFTGGWRPALVSVAITILDAVHFFSEPGLPLRYTPEGAASLLVVGVSTLVGAMLVARLHDRLHRAERLERAHADAEALSRRFSILEQSSLILTSIRSFDEVFRDLARLVVPTLADWCTIHVANEAGALRFVAGAHRDASRDLVVRALAEYGPRALPFAQAPTSPEVVEVTEALLRQSASDAEALKLYHALAPKAILRLPLGAAEQPIGFITLALATDSGRRFGTTDVDLAEELAINAGIAVENVRLRQGRAELERRSWLVFDAHPQPMWIFDVDTLAILAVNDAAVHHYGWTRDEFVQMTILDLLAPDDLAPLSAAADRTGLRGEAALAHHQRRDGTLIDMEIVSHELELDGRRARLVLASDISDRTRARAALHQSEEQLRQAHRAEALGRIAGGVAHDFNNLLTTIRGFGEMLLLDMVPDDRRRHDVERICQAADRGALLTRQLLSFGRQQAQEPRSVNLNDIVRDMEPLVHKLVGADVQLDVRLARALGAVRVDPAQLEHVVVNLILTAREAMPAGGRLTIETSERRISGLSPGRPVRPGRYVVLTVSDSGRGPDEDEEDGFAEAAAKSAVGMGRSIVFGIVRQYGGVVRIASEAGEGTLVKVYLPRLDPAESEETAAEPDLGAMRGSETVLVAEDEEGVRELIRKVLTEFGYTVLTARHGRDALLLATGRGDTVDLLVTDVVMPEMSGRELVETLRDRQPDLRVLYISGYTDDEILRRGISGSETGFMRKPFSSEELVRRVRSALDAPAA
jgi:two-component system, cell cycle sensor histidine kinase and response regulator CckA